MLEGQGNERLKSSCWVLNTGFWSRLKAFKSGWRIPVLPTSPPSWFPRISGHQLESRQGIRFPVSKGSILLKGLLCHEGLKGRHAFFAPLCTQLQIWNLARECSCVVREPDSVYSSITWSQRSSECQRLVPACHTQGPTWPSECLGLTTVGLALDPFPRGTG